MGPTNSRGPFCLPFRLPCGCACMLLPGCCAWDDELFWENFFFFRPWFWWPPCGWRGGSGLAWASGAGGGAGCCACWDCATAGWLDLFLRRRRRRRCPCDCPWPLAGAGPSSDWGCVESVVMRALPGAFPMRCAACVSAFSRRALNFPRPPPAEFERGRGGRLRLQGPWVRSRETDSPVRVDAHPQGSRPVRRQSSSQIHPIRLSGSARCGRLFPQVLLFLIGAFAAAAW